VVTVGVATAFLLRFCSRFFPFCFCCCSLFFHHMRGVSRVWLFRCEVVNGVEDGGAVGVFGYSGGFVTVKVVR
jgi:hypothetical protein